MPELPPVPATTPSVPARRFRRLRRILPLLLVLGAAVWYFRTAPRDVTLVFDLTGKRDDLRALKVEVLALPERTVARHLEFYYSPSRPAPPSQRHPLRLVPGEYLADAVLDYGARQVRSEQRFTLEREDEVFLAP